jgi:cytochrome c peroxidase
MPIQDHVEMGFSGTNGDPDIDSLIRKLNGIEYYSQLFEFVYGDTIITEARMQEAMSQFIRSIQSFDSKYDLGRANAINDGAPFSNFTAEENQGKALFLTPPPQGGAGCQSCHRAPEFDIDSASLNNGVVAVAGSPGTLDLTNTRAPSLRDLFNPNGDLNTPLMHNGAFDDPQILINHYNLVPINPSNTNLDPRLQGPGGNLGLTQQEKNALIAFLRTLTGSDVYSNPKWSDPFDVNGDLDVILVNTAVQHTASLEFQVFPNPTQDFIQLNLESGNYLVNVLDMNGRILLQRNISGSDRLDLSSFAAQLLLLEVNDLDLGTRAVKKVVKR